VIEGAAMRELLDRKWNLLSWSTREREGLIPDPLTLREIAELWSGAPPGTDTHEAIRECLMDAVASGELPLIRVDPYPHAIWCTHSSLRAWCTAEGVKPPGFLRGGVGPRKPQMTQQASVVPSKREMGQKARRVRDVKAREAAILDLERSDPSTASLSALAFAERLLEFAPHLKKVIGPERLARHIQKFRNSAESFNEP
jgi:hypothetical protein